VDHKTQTRLTLKKRGVGLQANPSEHQSDLLLFDRQIMNINMAGQTVREHLQLFLVVWFCMALTTVRHQTVLLMAHNTGHLAMFTGCCLPF
jgi:hypothetical protein